MYAALPPMKVLYYEDEFVIGYSRSTNLITCKIPAFLPWLAAGVVGT